MAEIDVSEELFKKVWKTFPDFMKHIEWKTNALAHMYFKSLALLESVGLKEEFLALCNPEEMYIYHGLNSCRIKEEEE